FGGVKISGNGEFENLYGRVIPGLYAAGEMVGGLFFHNYCSGTGLMSGATFGRLAGRNAAHFAVQAKSGAHAEGAPWSVRPHLRRPSARAAILPPSGSPPMQSRPGSTTFQGALSSAPSSA